MFRIVVTVLLMPCLLLTQFAAIAHTHSGLTHSELAAAGHGLRPHIHIHCGPHREQRVSHDHSHPNRGHSHHGHSHRHNHDQTGKGKPQSGTVQLPLDHDSDCVYVGEITAIGSERSRQVHPDSALVPCSISNYFASPAPQGFPVFDLSPRAEGRSFPPSLRTLVLRI